MSTNIKIALQAAVVCSFLALGACGGGGGSSPPPPPAVTAPAALSYPTPQTFQMGQAITALSPTVTGTVASYSVAPALPAGLSLNTTTGVISGTATAVAASASYVVTATNSGGSTTATVVIAVTDAPAAVVYDGGTNFTFTVGDPIDAVIPTVSGGTIASWTVSPALPAGLAFNTTNGTITGTATAVTSTATYSVTATTAAGAATSANLVIQVQSGLLLELGNTSAVRDLRFNGTRLLSQDSAGYWVLWDYAAAKILAHGQSACAAAGCATGGLLPLDLAGPAFVIGTPTGIDVYSSTDGTVLSRITANLSWWKLATDGSYIVGGNNSGLYAWNTSGKQIAVKSGDYHQAKIVALPGEVRVALGAAAANVIESVALPAGTSTLSAQFQGTFQSWFVDGGRFLTSTATTYWVYSNTATQQDLLVLPSSSQVGGQAGYFWSIDGVGGGTTLDVYAVGASTSPAFSTANTSVVKVEGDQLFVESPTKVAGAQSLQAIDLSGAAPVATTYTLPARVFPDTVAGTAGAQWVIGADHGIILDGSTIAATPRYLGFGEVFAVAGSANRFAIASAVGKIMIFNTSDNSPAITLDFPASKLALSADGSVLVAGAEQNDGQYVTDRSLNVYALPTGTLSHTWPSSFTASPYITDFTLSASGTVLAQVTNTHQGQVTPTNGGAVIWSGTTGGAVFTPALWLSPDGTLLAVPTDPIPGASTQIYNNGVLSTTVPGWGVGWLDNARLLVNGYIHTGTGIGENRFTGAALFGPTGTQLATTQLTDLRLFTPVTADTVYAPGFNEIFSLTTGNVVWSSPNPAVTTGYDGLDAIAGPEVVFVSRTIVRAETH